MAKQVQKAAGLGESELEAALREIAEAACENPGWDWPSKYGTEFENDEFMMHPYCWCRRGDCPWCDPARRAPHFVHKPSGFAVRWYKYIGRDMEVAGDPPADMLARCLASLGARGPASAQAAAGLAHCLEGSEDRVVAWVEVVSPAEFMRRVEASGDGEPPEGLYLAPEERLAGWAPAESPRDFVLRGIIRLRWPARDTGPR